MTLLQDQRLIDSGGACLSSHSLCSLLLFCFFFLFLVSTFLAFPLIFPSSLPFHLPYLSLSSLLLNSPISLPFAFRLILLLSLIPYPSPLTPTPPFPLPTTINFRYLISNKPVDENTITHPSNKFLEIINEFQLQ